MGQPVLFRPGHGGDACGLFCALDVWIFAVLVLGRGDRKFFRSRFHLILQQLIFQCGFVLVCTNPVVLRLRRRRLVRRRWRWWRRRRLVGSGRRDAALPRLTLRAKIMFVVNIELNLSPQPFWSDKH